MRRTSFFVVLQDNACFYFHNDEEIIVGDVLKTEFGFYKIIISQYKIPRSGGFCNPPGYHVRNS